MEQESITTQQSIVEENANYVLGMYDLYQNDQEITDALKLKGLEDGLIQKVLNKIKEPSYQKRIMQAKKGFISGCILVAVLLLIKFLLTLLPGSEDLLIKGERTGEGMLRTVFRIYSQIYFYIIVLGVFQIILSAVSFYKYKKLLSGL